ncbi:MAG: hypothetical protein JW700_00640 [Candidatus Aenigmarchaeota archaeon]|nr:hypothetical protein [Candidatus Aenigmarchaeota archaeon]
MHKDLAKVLFVVLFSLIATMLILLTIVFPIEYDMLQSMESIAPPSEMSDAQVRMLLPWAQASTADLELRMAGIVISIVTSLLTVLFVIMGKAKPFRITGAITLLILFVIYHNALWITIITLNFIQGAAALLYIATAVLFVMNLIGKLDV